MAKDKKEIETKDLKQEVEIINAETNAIGEPKIDESQFIKKEK